MSRHPMTLNELRRAGITALTQALGPTETIRFLQQFDSRSGDYTASRHDILGNPSVDDVLDELAGQREKSPKRKPGQ